MAEILIRPVVKEDLPFIYSTWLRSYRYSSDFAKEINNEIYYEYHHQVIDRIIARGARIFVACDKTSSETIFGYLVTESTPDNDIIHMAYIKKSFRGLGLFTNLLQVAGLRYQAGVWYTHKTDAGKKYLEKDKGIKFTYNPYLI